MKNRNTHIDALNIKFDSENPWTNRYKAGPVELHHARSDAGSKLQDAYSYLQSVIGEDGIWVDPIDYSRGFYAPPSIRSIRSNLRTAGELLLSIGMELPKTLKTRSFEDCHESAIELLKVVELAENRFSVEARSSYLVERVGAVEVLVENGTTDSHEFARSRMLGCGIDESTPGITAQHLLRTAGALSWEVEGFRVSASTLSDVAWERAPKTSETPTELEVRSASFGSWLGASRFTLTHRNTYPNSRKEFTVHRGFEKIAHFTDIQAVITFAVDHEITDPCFVRTVQSHNR